ncbi:7097_t:CDS:10, partial [Rhizophagus irregularis]
EPMTTNLAYFNAPPESWTIHGYYKFRKLQSDFSGPSKGKTSTGATSYFEGRAPFSCPVDDFSARQPNVRRKRRRLLERGRSRKGTEYRAGRLQSVKVTTDGVLNAIRTTNEIHQHNLLSLLPAGYSPKIGLNSDEQNTKSDFSSEYTPSTLLDSSSEYTPSDESGEDDVILRTDLHQKESNCSSPAKPENTELNEKYRKRQNTSHHEEGRIPKKQHKDKYTTPSCEAVYKDKWNLQWSELKFREVIKRAIKESWSSVKKWWLTELANDQTLDENLGFVILECLKSLPTAKIKNEPSETTLITNYLDHVMKGMVHDPNKYIVEWPNTGLDESKARKSGRSKQPDFVVSVIHQLQTSGVIFVGEVSPPSEKNNVYKNCNDLIRIGVFMKDCLDSAIDLGADIKTLGFQCVDYTVDFYMMDIVQGTYIMIHIGQISVPASVKEMLHFVDEIEILLKIREIFCKSFD